MTTYPDFCTTPTCFFLFPLAPSDSVCFLRFRGLKRLNFGLLSPIPLIFLTLPIAAEAIFRLLDLIAERKLPAFDFAAELILPNTDGF